MEIFTPKCFQNTQRANLEIKMGSERLEEMSSYNYLGVALDNKLKFDSFLKAKCRKINIRLHQLGNLRKFITNNIANSIYKQTIVPLFDYGDFLIESGQNIYIDRLDSIHSKALCIRDCKVHNNMSDHQLENTYRLLSPKLRRTEHHCATMYRLSRIHGNLDVHRPKINLRSRKKVKFRNFKTNLKGIDKSPMFRGIKLWDQIPQTVQRALTKVKFKKGLKTVVWTGF